MRLTNAMCVVAVGLASVFAACSSDEIPDDELGDVEEADGKADGWYGDQPFGTYVVRDGEAGLGEISTLTLHRDKTYRRETVRRCGDEACAEPKIDTGKFKFTQGGKSRYIRFLTGSGALRDRYAWELHGKQLLVRKVSQTTWQELWTANGLGTIVSDYAGAYTYYGYGSPTEGGIFELQLHDNGMFHMTIEAVHMCRAPGHSCSESYTDGYTGSSYVDGYWEDSEGGGGVTLHPTDAITGEQARDIVLAIAFDGAKATISGQDGDLALHGTLDVAALFSAKHEVAEADLTGTWKVEQSADPDHWRLLTGFGAVDNGREHRVTFDADTAEMCEISPNVNNAPNCGLFQVAGDPKGGDAGVIYSYAGSDFSTLRIVDATETKVVVSIGEDDGDYLFYLTRLE